MVDSWICPSLVYRNKTVKKGLEILPAVSVATKKNSVYLTGNQDTSITFQKKNPNADWQAV